jgi:predicted RNA-binding protein with PUA-like domain
LIWASWPEAATLARWHTGKPFKEAAMPKQAANYWLMKSEPEEVSIDDALAAPKKTVPWFGVRNYQARNFMRDGMQVGDGVLFYHSSCAEPGIVGIARVASTTRPDPTQFDKKSPYFDAKSRAEEPRWLLLDVQAVKKTRLMNLPELRAIPALADMRLLQRGNRLSVMPVDKTHWDLITKLLQA